MTEPTPSLATWRIVYGVIGALLTLGSGGCAVAFMQPGMLGGGGVALIVASPFIGAGIFLLLPFLIRRPLGPGGATAAMILSWVFFLTAAGGGLFALAALWEDQETLIFALPLVAMPLGLGHAYRLWSKDRA